MGRGVEFSGIVFSTLPSLIQLVCKLGVFFCQLLSPSPTEFDSILFCFWRLILLTDRDRVSSHNFLPTVVLERLKIKVKKQKQTILFSFLEACNAPKHLAKHICIIYVFRKCIYHPRVIYLEWMMIHIF